MEYIDSDNDGFLSFKEYKGKPFPLNLFSMLGLTLPISLLKEFTNTF